MENIFLHLVNLSMTAGWIVLVVLLLRLLLKKAPKWTHCLLWFLVGMRLILPFSIESIFSLIPSSEPIPQAIMTAQAPAIDSGIQIVNDTTNPIQVIVYAASIVWVVGAAAMLLYMAVRFLCLKHRLRTATRLHGNIWQSEAVFAPFIFGIIRPRIYLPYGFDEKSVCYVIAHEQAHLKRRDHWTKPIAFLILSVYWFHPLIWVAYVSLCHDIELACDEKVIKEMKKEERRAYSKTLIQNSVKRRMIAACPLAFGEGSIKKRVKNIMNYKKPALWFIVAAIAACAVVVVCFLTDPPENNIFGGIKNGDLTNNSVSENAYGYYTYTESVDPADPCIYLDPEGKYFSFGYSAFSSYYAIGSYELNEKTLVLKTKDGKYHYTFTICGNSFIFDAANSSEIPKYRYSAGAEPTTPVPDGAEFKKLQHDAEFKKLQQHG